ncbi:MAG: tRNA uridine-5-carboxymethylaminomethyl(34) synthesis GTPase MnmE [Lachnospiraceae bacterium]|nr:tRNA uridine-5-carboxymethylaminomethyl(34) synthesis GTPase MnmE [Lachnospiraceae bacterium]
MDFDTIAAISTGLTPGGIGIVRVSGKDAVALCAPLVKLSFGPLGEAKPNHLYYGRIFDGEKQLDEGLIAVLKAPHSYTAEDTVELQCHGGPFVLTKILELVLKAGARLAEPGEFTKRAFLNGRLDLSEAEAVMSLIEAGNEFARDTAVKQLSGSVSEEIAALRAVILEETAFIEAALDDPEHYSLDGYPQTLRPKITALLERISSLIGNADRGRQLAEGVVTTILGRPNVGKSSLMNRLLGEERVIVTATPGTTRDTIEETLRLGALTLRLADTAGLREGAGEIEQVGIERALKRAADSELILYVLDGSQTLSEEDAALLSQFPEKKSLVLINKSDLPAVLDAEDIARRFEKPVIWVSAASGEGIRTLEKKLEEMFALSEIRESPLVITNLRHKILLNDAYKALNIVVDTIDQGLPEDFYTVDLLEAYRALGLIIGAEADDDLVNEIFSKFCMGK